MTTAIKRRRGTTTQHSTFTGLEGEITVDTTKDTLVVHDGSTAGGFPLLREDLSNNTNVASTSTTQTFTNKTINLSSNTLTGTTAQFNTALSDGDFATLAGTETLSNKTFSTNPTISSGTANGVAYLNGSKVLTTGSALTFDGTNLGVGTTSPQKKFVVSNSGVAGIELDPFGRSGETASSILSYNRSGAAFIPLQYDASIHQFFTSTTEQMRLTSTGLGIGTSSPSSKLDVWAGDGNNAINLNGWTVTKFTGTEVRWGGVNSSQWQTSTFYTGGSERMRIDSSGNLGLGVTPSAWDANYKTLDIGFGSALTNPYSYTATWLSTNAYHNGTNFIYKNSAQATYYAQAAGVHYWSTAPSGTAGNAITFTQAMTLDASGRLLVGATSAVNDNQLLIQVNSTAGASKYFSGNNSGDYGVLFGYDVGVDGGSLRTVYAKPLVLGTNNTERMRIDSSGNLLVGTTVASSTGGPGFKVFPSATTPSAGLVFDINAGNYFGYTLYNVNATYNGYRFYVGTDGGIRNYSANNVNLSDERVKTNIELSGNYLDKICAIPVKLFNYKDEQETTQKSLGVIAQDVEKIAPELVNSSDGFGETPDDGVPLKTIYQTDLQYALMKCIQELKAELDATKAEVAALKGV